jgi:hypothetical protein
MLRRHPSSEVRSALFGAGVSLRLPKRPQSLPPSAGRSEDRSARTGVCELSSPMRRHPRLSVSVAEGCPNWVVRFPRLSKLDCVSTRGEPNLRQPLSVARSERAGASARMLPRPASSMNVRRATCSTPRRWSSNGTRSTAAGCRWLKKRPESRPVTRTFDSRSARRRLSRSGVKGSDPCIMLARENSASRMLA